MKKYILQVVCIVTILLGTVACLDDKSGNDFDVTLPDVHIEIPASAYSAALGEAITIEPVIETTIPEDDLEYIWEVNGDSVNSQGQKAFLPLLATEDQGRVLNYTAHIDRNITTLNLSYPCRLHVRQKSTGRDFYSANTFTITISGISGLMLLYGTSEHSDIGIVQAEDFTPSSMTLPKSPSASTQIYSMSNDGQLIPGKGKQIQQITSLYFTTYMAYYPQILGARCGQILALTDKDARWIDKDGFSAYGDWNYLFYVQGENAFNKGLPRSMYIYMIYIFGFDGGDIFSINALSSFPFLFADTTTDQKLNDGHSYSFTGQVCMPGVNPYPCLLYVDAVDGNTNHKGFVGLRSLAPGYFKNYSFLLDTKGDNTPFNPGNMHADLIKMARDNRGHALAVLKGDNTHPKYAGRYFAVDLQMNGTAPAGAQSTFSGIPQYLYDLSTLTNINDARFFEFGLTQNMCYYATTNGVYQWHIDGSDISGAEPLGMTDGSSWAPNGEITMMKIIDNNNDTPTHSPSETIMLVATWQNNQASLWSLHMDLMSGRINKAVRFDNSNTPGWNFNMPILDASIKNM